MTPDPAEEKPKLWPAVSGSVLGAGVGILIAGPIGAVLGAGAGPVAQRYLEHVHEEFVRRGEAVLSTAEVEASLQRDALLERLMQNPELEGLMARVVTASGSTALEAKLRGLGRALGRAIASEDRVDESLCLVAALNDMEAPHIRLLRLLEDLPPRAQEQENVAGWALWDIEHSPGLETVGDSVLAVLVRHGLVRDVTPGITFTGGGQFAPSDLGRLCLALVAATVPPGQGH